MKVGDFVFAKVRGFRAWPARVLQEEGNMYQVYFYGTCNIAKVRATQLFDYEKSKVRFGQLNQKKYGLFREAMQHAEKSLAHPGDDQGYFEAKAEKSVEQSPASTTPKDLRKVSGKVILPFIHITGDSD